MRERSTTSPSLDLALRDVRDATEAIQAARERLEAAQRRRDETIATAYQIARYGETGRVAEAAGMTPNGIRDAAARARRLRLSV